MTQPSLIIEHCEKDLSEWLMLEYRHASRIWTGNVIFTGVSGKTEQQALKPLGKVTSGTPKTTIPDGKCIILDPAAPDVLSPSDFNRLDGLVVGGILGYEQMQGRTKTLISDKYGYDSRNLGPKQLSIDGAVFVARAVMLGMELKDIEITSEIEIVHDSCHSTVLPFGYPVIGDKPIITPGLIEYLRKSEKDETGKKNERKVGKTC